MIHLPSGRVYIGQRKVPKGKTPENDSYFGSGVVWSQIYKKHKDECVKVIIDYADTKDEIDELEKKYIAHYKSVYKEFCVNIADGGDGGGGMKGKKHSEITKHKMSIRHKGENNPMYGNHSPRNRNKKFTDEELKEHRKLSLKKWFAKNKEYMKEYRLKNKEKIRECQRAWALKHKEEYKEYQREWYLKHKEHKKIYRATKNKKNNK